MKTHAGKPSDNKLRHPHARGPLDRFLARWFVTNTVLAGIFALCWLLLRSGSKPSRLVYPCQQAAFATAALAFGAPVVSAVVAIRRRVVAGLLTPQGIALAVLAAVATVGIWAYASRTDVYAGPVFDPPADYRAELFHETGCAQNPVGERFVCLDELLEMMGAGGLKFYRSATPSLTAGPDGILDPDDVVVVKINYQWPERGGTNTDLLRGLIRRIVDHPDNFTGEVVVAENTQFNSTYNFDRNQNNAQDISLSPHDVVVGFQAQGYRVSHYAWTPLRTTSVDEYGSGDMDDGYVVYPYDSALHGRVSYPKFQTAYGTWISVRRGIWTDAGGYDRESLKFINVPVLKSHHATYGATAMVKHYMGVVTDSLGTSSHGAIHYGILGALLGEIQPADLNILDAIWINANPFDGPWTTYGAATRMDQLVATRDPVAGDLWAVKNILIPAFEDNGYTPPWPYPSADPDDPSSAFRQYLDNSMNYVLAAGYDATNDPDQIDAITLGPPGESSDPEGSGAPFLLARVPGGYELTWSRPQHGGPIDHYNLYRTSLAGSPGAAQPECEATLGNGISATLSTLPADHGFIVVGRNAAGDGSFGRTGEGHERPSPLPGQVCP